MYIPEDTGKATNDGKKILRLTVSGKKACYVVGETADGTETLLEYDVKNDRIIPDKDTLKANYEIECTVDYTDPNGKFVNRETSAKFHKIDDSHYLGVHEYVHETNSGNTERVSIVMWQCGKDRWYPSRFSGKVSMDKSLLESLKGML